MNPKMTLQSWLEEKPFTLALSSGFFGFFAHAGVLKALFERDLYPQAYAGASAGAIVAACAAAGLSASEIEALVLGVKREDFWDPSPGFGLVRGRKLQGLLERNIGSSFSDLKKPLRVATFDVLRCKTTTFTDGPLARVVRASAAVPLLFHPVSIDRRLYLDGGIRDKMGLAGVPESERVFGHYLTDGKFLGHVWDKGPNEKPPTRRFLVLPNLPRSGPDRLHLGREILEAAYRASSTELDEELPHQES